jgi:hypothetical protein
MDVWKKYCDYMAVWEEWEKMDFESNEFDMHEVENMKG